MNRYRKIYCVMTFLPLLLASESVLAICTASSSAVHSPSLAAPADAPTGTVLGTVVTTTNITCDSSGTGSSSDLSWYIYLSASNSDFGAASVPDVRNTPKQGIGLRWDNLNSNTGKSDVFSRSAFNDTSRRRGIGFTGVTTFTDTFSFIKTGPIVSDSSVQTMTLGFDQKTPISGINHGPLFNYTLTIPAVKVTTCSVVSTALNVQLAQAYKTDFSGVGSTAKEKAFTIQLNNCDADLNVSLKLSPGNSSSSNTDIGLLSATANSSASGLALQLMYNNAPVKLDTTFNVLDAKTLSGGSYDIPLVVRYYQEAAQINSGVINSSATFTMTYN